MFNKVFGNGDKAAAQPPAEAAPAPVLAPGLVLPPSSVIPPASGPGIEVVDDDPDTAWSLWDSALAEQDSQASDGQPPQLPQEPAPASASTTAPAPSPVTEPAPPPVPAPAPAMQPLPVLTGFDNVGYALARPELPGNAPPAADFDVPTERMGLEPEGPEQRKAQAMEVMQRRHSRIATTLSSLWGHRECAEYMNRLIMESGDGRGNARVGFHAETIQALLVLAELHDEKFGPFDTGRGLGLSI